MDFAQLQAFVTVLIWLCGTLAAISGACAVVVKFWKYAHRQSDENASALEEIKSYLSSDKERIERLEQKQNDADEQNKLMLKALVTLMSHELDGNHTRQIGEVRDEIQTYLIER